MSTRDDWGDEPPPTEDEIAEAARLRDALEGRSASKAAEFAQAVRAAVRPEEIAKERHESIVRGALARRRGRLAVVAFGGVVFAAAAAAALVVSMTAGKGSRDAPAAALVPARPVDDLFEGPFPREGGESARVDRIAAARARDLRENHFARWGAR